MFDLSIFCEDDSICVKKGELFLILKICCDKQDFECKGRINLILVGDDVMRKLNKEYRKIDKVTDVLSFVYAEESTKEDVRGEIYISLNKIIEQAQEFEHDFDDELYFLFVHGVLHILGFDHKRQSEKILMEKMTKEIINAYRKGKKMNKKLVQS